MPGAPQPAPKSLLIPVRPHKNAREPTPWDPASFYPPRPALERALRGLPLQVCRTMPICPSSTIPMRWGCSAGPPVSGAA